MTNPTYRNGVGGQRCAVCYSLLRDAAGEPMIAVRVVDLEAALLQLDDGPTATRIEQVIGKTRAQVIAARPGGTDGQ